MDIILTDEQSQFRNSIQRLLKEEYSFSTRRAIIAGKDGWSRPHWKAFSELGLLSAPFAEEYGGTGDGPLMSMIVMQEIGRSLVVEPFFETVVLAGGLIEAEGTDAQRTTHLSNIGEGTCTWTLALAERESRFNLAHVATTALRDNDHFVLSGSKAAVVGGPWADKLIVTARTSGAPRDPKGVSLFIIDRGAENLSMRDYKTLDGRRAAELVLNDVRVSSSDLLGGVGQGKAALERCRDRAIAALCAEAVGAMTELNAATVEYSKTRKQFGSPLGKFQALQHRMVDMFVALQESISITQHLTLGLSSGDAGTSRLAAAAKTKVGYAARFIGEQAIQLHGGMGMSDELNVGHYFKRLNAIDILFGDPAFHLMRFARLQ
jgi:alkylation response protein AidB-like acyl-CoA dehydrogenase